LDLPALSDYAEPQNGFLLGWHIISSVSSHVIIINKQAELWVSHLVLEDVKNCLDRRKKYRNKAWVSFRKVESPDSVNSFVSFWQAQLRRLIVIFQSS
jgi:hypothetical protein